MTTPTPPAPARSEVQQATRDNDRAVFAAKMQHQANLLADRYDTARRTCSAATARFREVTMRYRRREIDDAEFLAARAEHQRAQEVFDIEESSYIDAVNRAS